MPRKVISMPRPSDTIVIAKLNSTTLIGRLRSR
ncbi:hypothetical protein EES40_02065 [Streptomyces sp. ADI93-02]|nr:hypothetical protein EES40_02065 [Streptomyces sp. ADI93-02]